MKKSTKKKKGRMEISSLLKKTADKYIKQNKDKYIAKGKAEGEKLGIAKGKAEGEKLGIAKGKAEGEKLGMAKSLLNSIKSIMETMNITAEKAMKALKIPQEEHDFYLAQLNTL